MDIKETIVWATTSIYISAFIIGGIVLSIAWKNNKDQSFSEVIRRLLDTPAPLRAIFIIVTIYSVIVLSTMGNISAGVTAIISGISGYVLGGMGPKKG